MMLANVRNFPIARSSMELLIPWFALLVFGSVMVASAAVALSGNYLSKHLIYLMLSLLLFFTTALIPISVWSRFYLLGWIVAVVIAVLVLVPGVGREVNGASRWLPVAGFTIQAAEVAKFGLVLYLAGYLQRYSDSLAESPLKFLIPLLMSAFVAALLIAEPDLGSAVVIMAAVCSLFFLAGIKLRYVFLLLLITGLLLALLIWIEPYRMRRLISFSDPWAVPYDSGYQLVQALIAVGRGELFGLGLGEGIQKLYYLPEAHNDFIFAVIAEELGGFGAIGLVVVFSFLVLKIFAVARRCVDAGNLFAGYASYFVGLIFAFQLLINMGVNTGVMPTKGLTLPFISYGGSSLMISCALFGLVFRSSLLEGKARV